MPGIWKDIGLIGRDTLLRNILSETLNPQKRFVLIGEAGVGKTAVLEWCAEKCSETAGRKTACVNAGVQNNIMLRQIVEEWGISVESATSKPTARELEIAVLQEQGHALFLDDLHKAVSAKLVLFKALSERHKVCGAMRPMAGKKDDLKQFLWGCKQVRIDRLKNADTERLAKELLIREGSRLEVMQVARASGGVPGRIVAMVNTGQILKNENRLRAEEIDIGPWLIGLFGFMAIFRVMGRQMDATDLTILGAGIMLIVRLFVYPFVSAGKQKG